MNFEKKARITGVIVTILVHAGVIIFCLLCAFITPLPLPGEEGVEVQLGYSDAGHANDYFVVPTVPTPVEPIEIEEPEEEEILTSESEEEPFVPTEEEVVEEIEEISEEALSEAEIEEPVVNPNALYRGSSSENDNNSGTTGTSGENALGGSQYGSLDSNNTSGLGGSGEGTSFSLEGRSAVSIPKPEYTSQEQGVIVVEIVVNKRGDVIDARVGARGTTISDQNLWNKAYQAAMRTKFSPNPKAADKQVGTITYNFRRLNE